MSQIMSHVEYLSKEIGPRPAGTEEEQQAALYITEQFQKEAGFTASMEDFSSSSNAEGGMAVLAGVAVVATILAIIFPVLAIPAFILAAIAAVVYALEAFDQPVLSRVLSRGASQNVVAKYQPGGEQASGGRGRARSRKVILVAHYDTGRVTPPLISRIESSGIPVGLVCVGAMIAAAFFLLIRIFIASGGGMGLLVLNVLAIIAAIICLFPIVKALLVRSAPYNEGATNNATGTAALIEIARRISRGSVSEADLILDAGEGITIHGEEAAREAGLIPEGAQIRYEAEHLAPPSEFGDYSEEERLLSAKAAIAALTGRPVERRVYGSVADNLVNSHADEAHAGSDAARDDIMAPIADAAGTSVTGTPAHDFSTVPGVSTVPAPAPASDGAPGDAAGFENAPSWFVAAQQNARKTERADLDEAPQIKRSRYTEAMENAERTRAEREEEARAAEWAEREAEQRAREEEARAALAANAGEETPVEPEPEPEGAVVDAVPQTPYGTVAMPAPIPASEVRAEALAADAMAEQAEVEQAAHDRISKLPSIDPADPYSPAPTTNPSRSGILRKLRTNIPSLSGLIAPLPTEQAEQPAADTSSAAHAPANIPALDDIPTITPDSAEQSFDSVAVPRSRSGNLLNRLRKNDDETLTDTPQQWLNVDDDFEARSVGRARGGWESFREEQAVEDAGEDPQATRRWEGGAFSRTQLGHVDMRSGEEATADTPIPDLPPEAAVEPSLTGEIEQIYHFRNPQFNTEIWFVAIGSDGENHDGARAFINEHHDELRGSMIVEIESLGAGVLSVASEEGRIRKVSASSRVKRYTRGATAETGISVDSVSLTGVDSITSTLQKAGYQAMHLFGAEDGRPALKGSADDVLENVDEHALDEHVGFVYELLKG